MTDLLAHAANLPEVTLDAGEVLIEEGTTTGSIWVLLDGNVEVVKDGVVVSSTDRPGAVYGEVAALLAGPHTATVRAATPCRFRHAADGRAFLLDDPQVLLAVAEGLAQRLGIVTAYLADLRRQYDGAPGLAMVSDVLGRLTEHRDTPARPGSARDPDPDY